ncbi:hypothetical protein [Thalassococcus sp. S3]|uniref:hypothetical protein n=1 Tax=Thalassococcus sp. S3 TaxID=2017482 RepID=UPI00102CD4D7|nr:hypothetical protein [Thalassococcus sp. S3]
MTSTMNQEIVGLPGGPAPLTDRAPLTLQVANPAALMRGLSRVLGAACLLGAPMLWRFGGSGDPVLLAMKVGVTVLLLVIGLAFVTAPRAAPAPEIQFDPILSELRILAAGPDGQLQTVMQRRYDTLGNVLFHPGAVTVHDCDGSVLLDLPLRDDHIRQALQRQLGALSPC